MGVEMTRVLDVTDGFTSVTTPTVEPVYPTVSGTPASPVVIGVAGITNSSDGAEVMYLESDGGQVTVTADPQISAGAQAGAQMTLVGTSDTDTVVLTDGMGLILNGSIELDNGKVIGLTYDGTNWREVYRNA
jgi:hypothetical protein